MPATSPPSGPAARTDEIPLRLLTLVCSERKTNPAYREKKKIPYIHSPPRYGHEMTGAARGEDDTPSNSPSTRPHLSPLNSQSQKKLLVVVNSSGRQASSVIRVASAVGYRVRGQLRNVKKNQQLSAELQALNDVELVEGSLEDPEFVDTLFDGADLAFINTTPYGWTDEVMTGKRLADAAKKAGIQFFVYSGLTDHSKHGGRPLPPLPLWKTKFEVEEYIRKLGIPAAFPYVGCYHNNFSSRPYPLWELTPISDGSFEWRTPFPEDVGIPFIDTEHDLGAAVIQILKEGPRKWNGKRFVSRPSKKTVLTWTQNCPSIRSFDSPASL
jgi:hypothetical protein